MNIEKRKRCIRNIYASIHTLSGKCDCISEAEAVVEPIVKTWSKKKVRNKECYEHYLQLNPNKAVDSHTMIKKYSDFKNVLYQALENMEAVNFEIKRADLSFNSDDPADFDILEKLNRLLICCIADSNNIKNCYHTTDLWSNKSLSIACKSDTIEIENYDKEAESNGNTEAKNRLEIRSKRMNGSLEDEFMKKWFSRLDKAVNHFESVQERYNNELYTIWMADQEKEPKERTYISLDAFLMCYRDCYFTRKQFESFLVKIGVEKASSKAKKFKQKHRIEFYSKTDLYAIVKALKNATIEYFSN